MFNINHISFLRTKKVPYERAKYFFNLGLSQIEKPDDLQSIADPIRFFSHARRPPSMMEIVENSVAAILT